MGNLKMVLSMEEREKTEKLKYVKYRANLGHFIEKKNRAGGEIILNSYFTFFYDRFK